MTLTIKDSLPTAEEARVAYIESRSQKVQEETQRAVQVILTAQHEGKSSATIHPPIRHQVIEKQLRDHGYSVTTRQTGPNEHSTEVAW